MRTTFIRSSTISAVVLATFSSSAFSAYPVIHAAWDGGGTPILNTHYFVNTSSPASLDFPDVELVAGHLDWRIWSTDTDNTDGYGDIGVISSPHANNYAVRIANLSDSYGARDVKGITLIPTSSSNYSNISGFIKGDLLDDLALQTNTSGTGGNVDFYVDDTISADLELDKVAFLWGRIITGTIEINQLGGSAGGLNIGYLYGDIEITSTVADDALIRIFEPLEGSVTVSSVTSDGEHPFVIFFPGGITDTGSLSLGATDGPVWLQIGASPGDGEIAGSIDFLDGISAESLIWISTELTSTGVIDLHNGGIAESAVVYIDGGGDGSIVNGGAMDGYLELGASGTEFTSSAEFTSVTGSIVITGEGTLDVSDILDGNLCGTGIAYDDPLPNNILIGCGLGSNATLCNSEPTCPSESIDSASPPDGTQDSRQPHPKSTGGTPVTLASRQGIGSPNPSATADDIITITLSASGLRAISHDCWTLCETGIEAVDTGTSALSANEITCITETEVGGDTYEIRLARPISAGYWTTIEYVGGGSVSYASLPADSSGNEYSAPADILAHIDCCINETCSPPFGVYSCDIDHSGGAYDEDDTGALIDLLNGAGNFVDWYGQDLESNECEESFFGGGGGGSESFTNADFSDWLVNYISTTNPVDSLEGDRFTAIVASLTQWCIDHFATKDLADLADDLSDPGLTFASSAGEEEAANVVAAITP